MAQDRPATVSIPRELIIRLDAAQRRLLAAEQAIVKASEDATLARRELGAVNQALHSIANPSDTRGSQRSSTTPKASATTSWLPHTAKVDSDPFVGPPVNPRAARGVAQIKV